MSKKLDIDFKYKNNWTNIQSIAIIIIQNTSYKQFNVNYFIIQSKNKHN